MFNHPERIGKELASSVDMQDIVENSSNRNQLITEICNSFKVQFEENQKGVQHEVLEYAAHTINKSDNTITESKLISIGTSRARDVLYNYADTLLSNSDISKRDLPPDEFFEFRENIVRSYLR